MNKITWMGDRLECNSPELDRAKYDVLHGSHRRLYEFMKACDLPMYDYSYGVEGDIYIHRWSDKDKLVYFPIADEGAGFNVCFHLGAYAIASMNLGQKLEICAYSFKSLLHPVLFQGLSKWFSDQPAQEVHKNCSYYSGDSTLKCAVNPSLPCKDCSDVSAGFNENLFVWKGTELGDRLAMCAFARLNNSDFGWADRAMGAYQGGDRGTSIRIPRIGVDQGSGQDATAIATGFIAEDGSIHVNSLCLAESGIPVTSVRGVSTI